MIERIHGLFWRRWPFRGTYSNAVNRWFFRQSFGVTDMPALDAAEVVIHNTDDIPAVCVMPDGMTVHVFGEVRFHTGEDAVTHLQREADYEAEIALAIENGDAT